jgi:hypothetical protein
VDKKIINKMKTLLILLLLFFSNTLFGQNSINEIKDLSVRNRVANIRNSTDSFLAVKVGLSLKEKFAPDFGVTFIVGEFAVNYLLLNRQKIDSSEINNLIQYYYLSDTKIHLKDTVGIYYDDSEMPKIRFAKPIDSLSCIAVKKIYSLNIKRKIEKVIKEKKLTSPFLKISIDEHTLKYFIILKDKVLSHNFYIF